MKDGIRFSTWVFLFTIGYSSCVNVHFENKDGGFFIKQQTRQHFSNPETINNAATGSGVPLSIDKFTVFQKSQPISVRATYGPFSTKQTVPAKYIVPDPLPVNTSGPSIDLQDQATHHLDMSAHIVRDEIPRDSPVLRVLFHTGTDPGGRRQVLLARHHQRVCIVLHATMGNRTPLHAACSPDGEDGVCLAQVTIPPSWWPPLPSPDKDGRPGKLTKTPPRLVQVAYSVLEPWPDEGEGCHPKMQVQPSATLGNVKLVPAKGAYKELKLTDAVTILVPHPPLFPMSRIYVPVFVDREKSKLMTAIVVKARMKSGVRFLEAVPIEGIPWNVTIDINPRHTSATVTLIRKEPPDTNSAIIPGDVIELFSWLIEISEDATENYDGSKIVWSARYEPHQDQDIEGDNRKDIRKLITRFEIQKDDIQAVVPISKNWEVLNTAVLTGLQVSQTMKVFIVSQAGKAADVTFQSSCHSEDESVLKVSSSCGSVYVDGSEARGSENGSVIVKYGTYTGIAQFTVWMPEFPLDLYVADTRLSQLKSWRVPDYHPSMSKARKRRRRSLDSNWGVTSIDETGNVVDKPICRLRYQQTSVDVYARFLASDHSSGHISYLINRRTFLRVTDLVLPWLRVSDPRIASLHGRILQGRSVGRTEVQVLSPITSRVYGSKEVRVGNDKVGLTKLYVQVVSGLQLNISPDSSLENVYVAETGITRKLTAQYQEGLLDIELEFSDRQKTPLRDIADTDYHLVVESLDPEVVAFAPMVASHHPRVIAVGEGSGDLLQVTLLLAEECRNSGKPKTKATGPLASASATINVDFSSIDLHRPDILQNDGGSYGSSKAREFSDLQDILKGSSIHLENSDEPNVLARQFQGNKGISRQLSPHHSTPLEISMYVLLAAFCCAILVFVVSCVVYASKFKPINPNISPGIHTTSTNFIIQHESNQKSKESTTNAHDWVWLGRATIEPPSQYVNNTTDMRIITNPLNMNYCEPDDSLMGNSFSNPTHIELPATDNGNSNRQIDSRTYSRGKESGQKVEISNDNDTDIQVWNKPTPPPPLPSHSPNNNNNKNNSNDDYKPPVPPHRNLSVSTTSSDSPLPKKSQHHHHHRNKNQDKINQHRLSDDIPLSKTQIPTQVNVPKQNTESCTEKDIFEFDDEPQESPKRDDNIEFVQYSNNPSNRNSTEVKTATIVGNPMFNVDATNIETGNKSMELPGLDDLQLDMDYDQIMQYFENLKESNA
ncbi:transmembrane protein 132E isoform X1 [Diorhabda carinulata]|uniref:transmembrane protein 132E isoform X1 n=2 Tax=Diorhabda carinulata TaxID=1163345 RepID=UPI00259FE95C|nr:transmembrane protein 132E isoform X1 [Diorhabda carinulata]